MCLRRTTFELHWWWKMGRLGHQQWALIGTKYGVGGTEIFFFNKSEEKQNHVECCYSIADV